MQVESLTISAREAASLIGCGKTTFYQMASDGRLGPVPILGGRYDRQEIIDWVRWGQCCSREEWMKFRREK
jgi:excisionase family DNA binding protein